MNMEKKAVTGRIFDIQRFSIHDGPGIRTIIFLKGCGLRCKWCCNPESQRPEIQSMKVQGKEKIIGRDVTVQEVMEEIKKDYNYYRRSGGGVTLSGGEALLQPDFAVELLKACQDFGISTAIETAGFASFDVIGRYLPYVDVFLMDIKHMDCKKHEQFTGRPNELILENARKIAEAGADLIIRVPVVPTFNETREEIMDIANFAKTLPGVKELHLLPYHRLGQDKYEGLGRTYDLAELVPPDNVHMSMLAEAAGRSGLQCQIGG